MAFATIRGARILSLFKCPFNNKASSRLAQNPQRLMATRNATNERSNHCAAPSGPACGSRFKPAPCNISKQTKKERLPQPAPKRIQDPEIKIKRSVYCCGDPCPDALPSFDKLYYRRSDKMERDYQQTWDECPEMNIQPKVICCNDPIRPVLKRRMRKERPQTACKQEVCLQSKTKCPFVHSPGCKPGRKPPNCARITIPKDCVKRPPPYPSFSECKRSKTRAPILECNCLAIPSICEVWAFYHRKNATKKPLQC